MSDIIDYLDHEIPSLIVEGVDPNKMKTMAAILRDPYPVHWDKDANETLGLEGCQEVVLEISLGGRGKVILEAGLTGAIFALVYRLSRSS